MAIHFNKVNNLYEAKRWIVNGWRMFKKKPLTWVVMLLIFNIFFIVGNSFSFSRYIVALILPVLMGGIFLAAHYSYQNKPISIENLFSMFKKPDQLKQLLIIGVIGMVALFLSSLIGSIVMLLWVPALLFSVPLVAIKKEQAISALQSSLMASISNLPPIILFYFMTMILMFIALIPIGLGLLVFVPVMFGAIYSAFKMIFLEDELMAQESINVTEDSYRKPTDTVAATLETKDERAPELNLGEKLANNMRSYIVGATDSDGETTLPRGFEINYYDEYMHIIRRWHGFQTFGLIASMLVFNGVWIANDFWAVLMSDRELLLRLFVLTFILIGVVLPYFVIASWINKTNIYVSKEAIEIKHEPLPWLGNKRVDTHTIKQLFVKEKGGDSQRITSTNDKRPTYSVIGVSDKDEQFDLIKGLSRSNQAFYIEQRIEKYLGIEDVANPEEFGYGFLKKED